MRTEIKKRKYEPMELSVIKFETEEILWTSGFFGDEDDLSESTPMSIFADNGIFSKKNQVNPT